MNRDKTYAQGFGSSSLSMTPNQPRHMSDIGHMVEKGHRAIQIYLEQISIFIELRLPFPTVSCLLRFYDPFSLKFLFSWSFCSTFHLWGIWWLIFCCVRCFISIVIVRVESHFYQEGRAWHISRCSINVCTVKEPGRKDMCTPLVSLLSCQLLEGREGVLCSCCSVPGTLTRQVFRTVTGNIW